MRTEHCGWKDVYKSMGVESDFSGAADGPGEWDYLDEEPAELPAPTRAKLSRAIHLQEAPVEVEG